MTHASNTANLCSSVMQLESLHRLGVKAERVLLYPDGWDVSVDSIEAQLLRQALGAYGAVLMPMTATQENVEVSALAQNQTAYRRVIALDPDSTIVRSMDDAFFSRTRERDDGAVTVISLSSSLFQGVQDTGNAKDILVNHTSPLMRLLRTSQLRQKDHITYLSSSTPWSAKAALIDATLVHFTDGPPWKPLIGTERDSLFPACPEQETCEDLEIWQWLYADFRARRKAICGEQFNEWESEEAQDETNRRIVPLQDRVNGIGGDSEMD